MGAKPRSSRGNMGLRLEILDELLGSIVKRNYEKLLQALNERLEDCGDATIGERTLKYDIGLLERKGAPIHRPTKSDDAVYYTEKFSLKQIVIDDDEVYILRNAVAILKKATNLKLTLDVEEIISRLENRIHTNVPESNTMIAFEEHTEARGKEHFEQIFSAIKDKTPIRLSYQPFKKEVRDWEIHPYMLKEYRNRWFLIGRVGNGSLVNLRLDSIKGKIKNSNASFIENNLFDPEVYFNNVIGVTIPKDEEPLNIQIKVSPVSADYVRTKPIHKSQIIKKEYSNGGILIEIVVFNNYELKSNLMSYGPAIEIVKPLLLREEMKNLFQKGLELY